MTPEALLGNAETMLLTLLPKLGAVALVVGTAAYVVGKATGSSDLNRWAKNAWLGGAVGLAGVAVVALITNVAQRVSGVA